MCNPHPLDNFDELEKLIRQKVPDAKVFLQNHEASGHHLKLLVVSETFKGQMLLAQHRTVMDALKEKFSEDLHAIEIKTLTPERHALLNN